MFSIKAALAAMESHGALGLWLSSRLSAVRKIDIGVFFAFLSPLWTLTFFCPVCLVFLFLLLEQAPLVHMLEPIEELSEEEKGNGWYRTKRSYMFFLTIKMWILFDVFSVFHCTWICLSGLGGNIPCMCQFPFAIGACKYYDFLIQVWYLFVEIWLNSLTQAYSICPEAPEISRAQMIDEEYPLARKFFWYKLVLL